MPFVILPTNSASGGYDITNSLRFNSGSSDDLSRTISVAGDRQKFTISTWVKRGSLTVRQQFIGAYTDANNYFYIEFSADNTMYLADSTSSALGFDLTTTQVFRDVSAWYHIVLAVDTTQATNTNRLKLYVNGSQVTAITATYPTQNFSGSWNKGSGTQRIGYRTSGFYFSGYQSEVYHIDGQALTPSSFGETDEDTGIWKPKAYTGTYGTNGFYLQFKNSASLGTDSSGNGNTFTVNNLTSIDQTTDTPTNNFTLLNSLVYSSASKTYGEGNTAITASSVDDWCSTSNTIGVRSGKWYAEIKINSVGSFSAIGVGYVPYTNTTSTQLIGELTGSAGWRNNGVRPQGGTNLNTYTTGDILMVAMDMDNRKLYFGKNGTWENSGVPTSGATGTGSILDLTADQDYFFVICPRGGSTYCNFGNPAYSANSYTDSAGFGNFSYSVPSGFFSLNTKNLAQYG